MGAMQGRGLRTILDGGQRCLTFYNVKAARDARYGTLLSIVQSYRRAALLAGKHTEALCGRRRMHSLRYLCTATHCATSGPDGGPRCTAQLGGVSLVGLRCRHPAAFASTRAFVRGWEEGKK